MDTFIKADQLTKQYQHIIAVNKVSLQIASSKFHVIMGRSGSGKTTLLSLLGLLDTPSSGSLIMKGQDVTQLSSKELAHLRMKELGFVFQEFHLNPVLNALENVMVPMYINPAYTHRDIRKRAMELLDQFNLSNRYSHLPSQLSGGEQQRVALARALANDPSCILADEPTGNLDRESEKVVLNHLKELSSRSKCIVVVTHNELVLNYADSVFTMSDGILTEGEKYES